MLHVLGLRLDPVVLLRARKATMRRSNKGAPWPRARGLRAIQLSSDPHF
ncbi:MAG: hypothetical protein R3F49_10130 [Planctomycetota bacterium]